MPPRKNEHRKKTPNGSGPKNSKKCFGVPWAWLALGGRKRIQWILATFRDFEPQEHVPRTSARAHTCTAVFTRAPCVPRNREHEKRPGGGRAKNVDVQKKSIWYIVIQGFSSRWSPEIPGVSQVEKGEHRRSFTSCIYKPTRTVPYTTVYIHTPGDNIWALNN